MCINSSLRDLKTNIPHVFLADDCVHSSLVNYPLQNDASQMGLPVRKVLKLHFNLKNDLEESVKRVSGFLKQDFLPQWPLHPSTC